MTSFGSFMTKGHAGCVVDVAEARETLGDKSVSFRVGAESFHL